MMTSRLKLVNVAIRTSICILLATMANTNSHAVEVTDKGAEKPLHWQAFFGFDGTFKLDVPGLPELVPVGTDVTYVFRTPKANWLIHASDAEGQLNKVDIEAIFRARMAGIRDQMAGEVAFHQDLEVEGRQAFQFGVTSDVVKAMGRGICVQNRFYFLTRFSPFYDVSKWDEQDRFLNSIELLPSRIARNRSAKRFILDKGFGQKTLAHVFACDRKGKFEEAADVARLHLEAAYVVRGQDHADTGMYQTLLGRLLGQAYQFEEALFHLNTGLDVQLRLLPKDDLATISTLGTIATVLRNQSDFVGSRQHFEKMLAAHKRTKGEESLEVAHGLFNLARTIQLQGNFTEAQSYAEQSLALFEKLSLDDHTEVESSLASCQDMLGSIATQLRQFATARRHLNDAYEARRKTQEADGLFAAITEHNLGYLDLVEGDAASAVARFEQALATITQQQDKAGPTHLTALEVRRSLATALVELGRTEEAKEHLVAIVEARRQIFDGPNQMVAAGLSDLACLSLEKGDLSEAIEYLKQAYEMDRKIGVEQHPHPEVVISNIGSLYFATGQLDLAKKSFEETKTISEAKYGADHPRVSLPLASLAAVEAQHGHLKQAKALLKQSRDLIANKFDSSHPQMSDIEFRLGKLHERAGEVVQAIASFHNARQSSRRFIASQLAAIPDHEQLRFLATRDRPALEHVLAFGARHTGSDDAVTMSAEWLANGKSVTAEVLAERIQLTRDHKDPAVKQTATELTLVRGQLARAFLNRYSDVDHKAIESLARLSRREEQLTKELAQETGRRRMRADWISVEEMRNSLPADAVYVDMIRLRTGTVDPNDGAHYYAWIVPSTNGGEVRVVDLGPASQIDARVGELRQAMLSAPNDIREIGEREAEHAWRATAKALSQTIFGPLEADLQGINEVIVSPDGALWLVSLDSLLLKDGRYAGEALRVRYILSGREVLPTPATATATGDAVVFANPDFDWASNAAHAKSPANRVHGTRPIPRFTRLPATESEANAIRDNLAAYTGTSPRVALDRDATEEAIKEIERPKALVLSTHGFFLKDQELSRQEEVDGLSFADDLRSLRDANGERFDSPLIRCGLTFARCNRREVLGPTTEDGLLTGLEVLGLDLQGTQLVVLSACETGIGEPRIGEGVASLRQAFLLAGSETVVSSLWNVDSLETARLMNLFFKQLANGESRGKALHNAKLERIHVRRDRRAAAHPYFWASFAVTGAE